MKGLTIILKKSLSEQVRYQVNTSMEIKEQISIIKQKRSSRKMWKNIMNTMWDSRKSYNQQQDILVIDYYDRIISERYNQSLNTHKLDQLWHQLKKK